MKRSLFLLLALLIISNAFSQSIKLPAPQKTGGMPLMEALAKRSSFRVFEPKELTLQQLSNLCWAAFGINRTNGKRTAPSARDFQETDVYVLLKKGAYIYDAKNNILNLVTSGYIEEQNVSPFVKEAPVNLVLVADFSKMGNGSKEEKLNTANIDAGYISQNIYLFCASEKLATVARGTCDRKTLNAKLKLRDDQVVILAHSLGYPKQ